MFAATSFAGLAQTANIAAGGAVTTLDPHFYNDAPNDMISTYICDNLTDRDADTDIDVAAYWLAEELPAALHVCYHLHGGLGVDDTYPLHRYYSWAKDLARFVGGRDYRLDRLGDRVGN